MTYSRLSSRALLCVFATVALVAACSSGVHSDVDPDGGGELPDAGDVLSDASTAAPVLCDGSESIRLAYQIAGGGPVMPPSQVLSENGFVYLLVTGTCHYWVLQNAGQEVREGDSSARQATSLAADLRLGMWSGLPAPGPACPDAPTAVLRFGDERYLLPVCGPSTGDLGALMTALQFQVDALYGVGLAVTGPVRFVLVGPAPDWSAAVQAQATLWPLADPAASFAITTAQANMYQRGSASVATGAAAASLRIIRDASTSTNIGSLTGGYLPVVDEAGTRYQLYLRDSIPPEDPQGLLPPI